MEDLIWLENIKRELKRDILKEDRDYVVETLEDQFSEIEDKFKHLILKLDAWRNAN